MSMGARQSETGMPEVIYCPESFAADLVAGFESHFPQYLMGFTIGEDCRQARLLDTLRRLQMFWSEAELLAPHVYAFAIRMRRQGLTAEDFSELVDLGVECLRRQPVCAKSKTLMTWVETLAECILECMLMAADHPYLFYEELEEYGFNEFGNRKLSLNPNTAGAIVRADWDQADYVEQGVWTFITSDKNTMTSPQGLSSRPGHSGSA